MTNLSGIKWTKQTYQEFIKKLETQADLKYKQFHGTLIKDNNLIGIRIPTLRNIAKQISKGDYQNFLKENKHQTYEENILHGFVISYSKTDFDTKLKQLDEFLPYINNWAICDCTCSTLKSFKNNQEEGYQKIIDYLNSNNEWTIRTGLVLLLNYYINDQYIDQILKQAITIKNQEYYVEMANAWLISMCYIKYPKKTEKLLKQKILNTFTQNKSIDKIRDSYRVTKEDKKRLLNYKITSKN